MDCEPAPLAIPATSLSGPGLTTFFSQSAIRANTSSNANFKSFDFNPGS
jgi:hypothetical protein